jgi:hypothetical protein
MFDFPIVPAPFEKIIFPHSIVWGPFLSFFVVMGFQLSTSSLLSRCSTTPPARDPPLPISFENHLAMCVWICFLASVLSH